MRLVGRVAGLEIVDHEKHQRIDINEKDERRSIDCKHHRIKRCKYGA